jgi:hypothetical protein
MHAFVEKPTSRICTPAALYYTVLYCTAKSVYNFQLHFPTTFQMLNPDPDPSFPLNPVPERDLCFLETKKVQKKLFCDPKLTFRLSYMNSMLQERTSNSASHEFSQPFPFCLSWIRISSPDPYPWTRPGTKLSRRQILCASSLWSFLSFSLPPLTIL